MIKIEVILSQQHSRVWGSSSIPGMQISSMIQPVHQNNQSNPNSSRLSVELGANLPPPSYKDLFGVTPCQQLEDRNGGPGALNSRQEAAQGNTDQDISFKNSLCRRIEAYEGKTGQKNGQMRMRQTYLIAVLSRTTLLQCLRAFVQGLSLP